MIVTGRELVIQSDSFDVFYFTSTALLNKNPTDTLSTLICVRLLFLFFNHFQTQCYFYFRKVVRKKEETLGISCNIQQANKYYS